MVAVSLRACLLLLLLGVLPVRAGDVQLGVLFHVADGLSDAFLAEQLAGAQAVFAPHGVTLVEAGRRALPKGHEALVSRADRDALGAYLRPGVINCMVVQSLMDVDEPGRVRRGVHWRVRKEPARHFVIVSAVSGRHVLAHELGHFLGNQAHSEQRDNLMSYDQSGTTPFLAPAQLANVRETVTRMLAQGELVAR